MHCKRLTLVVLLLGTPAWAAAQVCTSAMSLQECWDALNGPAAQAPDEGRAATTAAAKTEANTANTGSQNSAESATDDFNPKLHVSADGVSDGDKGGITLSWADILFGQDRTIDSAGQQYKVVAKLENAELFEPLAKAITDTAVKDALTESLGDFDDVRVDFKLSLSSKKYGRDLQSHQDLVKEIQRVTLETVEPASAMLLSDTDGEDKLSQGFVAIHESFKTNAPMSDSLSEAEAQQLIAAATAARSSHLEYVRVYESTVRQNGLFDLVDLVNNQPQLVLTLERRVRADAVGPDKTSLKFSYELGGKNVNDFRRYQTRQSQAGAPEVARGAAAQAVADAARSAATANPADGRAAATAANSAAAVQASNPATAASAAAVARAAAAAVAANLTNADAVAHAAEAAARKETAAATAARPCATTVSCLKSYVADNQDAIRGGNRVSFSLAFVDTGDFHFNESGVTLDLPSERSLVAQLNYGRYVGTRNADTPLSARRSRIDLGASYEDVKGDPARQNRALANVTFTQEVSRGLFLTVGLVWASKPEYRGAVDEELSARAGISYKLASKKE